MALMTWGRPGSFATIIGTDPTTGTDHAIPNGATAYTIYAVGTGAVAHRTTGSSALTNILTTSNVVPVGVLAGPYAISPQADTHIQVAEIGAAAITAYYISFMRG